MTDAEYCPAEIIEQLSILRDWVQKEIQDSELFLRIERALRYACISMNPARSAKPH